LLLRRVLACNRALGTLRNTVTYKTAFLLGNFKSVLMKQIFVCVAAKFDLIDLKRNVVIQKLFHCMGILALNIQGFISYHECIYTSVLMSNRRPMRNSFTKAKSRKKPKPNKI
jgi:hypothetical protein